MVVRRVEALAKFLGTDDGKNLLAGTKRAITSSRSRRRKDKRSFDGAPDVGAHDQILDEEDVWRERSIQSAEAEASAAAVGQEDFAVRDGIAMSNLRPCGRCVLWTRSRSMTTTPEVRENRLKLLNEIRATRAVADFSRSRNSGAAMDRQTLAAYDKDAAAFAKTGRTDSRRPTPPRNRQTLPYQGQQTADIGCGSGREGHVAERERLSGEVRRLGRATGRGTHAISKARLCPGLGMPEQAASPPTPTKMYSAKP